MPKYQVTLRYRGSLDYEVEAENEREAGEIAFAKADPDQELWGNLELDDTEVEEILIPQPA